MRFCRFFFRSLTLLGLLLVFEVLSGAFMTMRAEEDAFQVIDVHARVVRAEELSESFTNDLYLAESDVRVSDQDALLGQTVRIYVSVHNSGASDLTGVVRFYDELSGQYVGTDQPVSIVGGKTDDVFVDWAPTRYGAHPIAIRVKPTLSTGDNTENNKAVATVFVDNDFDGDGVGNRRDSDDDNDGAPDNEDLFPYNAAEAKDTDNDGLGNNADDDDDNDDVKDVEDLLPTDPAESKDSDRDGTGDHADSDDDNDGILDTQELTFGTDPYRPDPDSDSDGLPDAQEQAIGTSSRQSDTDGDGVNDKEDLFPTDPDESKDTDQDGVGDNSDSDSDNDGVPNTQDAFPLSLDESKDTDQDGIGDNSDSDSDNDGVPNDQDIFPLDVLEFRDSDRDGLGDNADPNDSNQGPVPVIETATLSIGISDVATFNALKSRDPDGQVVRYSWDFGDGATAEGVVADHRYQKTGRYDVRLTITDDHDESREAMIVLEVHRAFTFWALIALIVFLILFVLFRFVVFPASFRIDRIPLTNGVRQKSLRSKRK